MSSISVRYVCSNCGKNTREGNVTQPKQCALCKKVVCHHCSPKGFCEMCLTKIPDNDKAILDKNFARRKAFSVMIWIFLSLILISTVMVVITGGTEFIANNPNAETLQMVFMILGGVLFFGACPLAFISIRVVRKTDSIIAEAAIMAKQNAQQTGVPIPNVGVIIDHELFTFISAMNKSLRNGPKQGINEIVHNLISQGITPARQDFVELVNRSVSARFRKTKEPGNAIVVFLVITSIMELLSQVEGKPYSTLDKLPANVRDFLYRVMNIPDADKVAKKIILG